MLGNGEFMKSTLSGVISCPSNPHRCHGWSAGRAYAFGAQV
jgi:hypothetical protein